MATKGVPPQQQGIVPQQPALPKTKTVLIENLAASTTEQQLKSFCQGIGVLEVCPHFTIYNFSFKLIKRKYA